jgi:hypothetical protein
LILELVLTEPELRSVISGLSYGLSNPDMPDEERQGAREVLQRLAEIGKDANDEHSTTD